MGQPLSLGKLKNNHKLGGPEIRYEYEAKTVCQKERWDQQLAMGMVVKFAMVRLTLVSCRFTANLLINPNRCSSCYG